MKKSHKQRKAEREREAKNPESNESNSDASSLTRGDATCLSYLPTPTFSFYKFLQILILSNKKEEVVNTFNLIVLPPIFFISSNYFNGVNQDNKYVTIFLKRKLFVHEDGRWKQMSEEI